MKDSLITMHHYHLVFLLATSLVRDAFAAPHQVPLEVSVAETAETFRTCASQSIPDPTCPTTLIVWSYVPCDHLLRTGPRRKLQGRFLHITDMHPDPHYRVGMSEKSACHRKKPRKAKERSGEFGMPYRCVVHTIISASVSFFPLYPFIGVRYRAYRVNVF